MSNILVLDLLDQYRRALGMVIEEISRFGPTTWGTGTDEFLIPVNVAMHLADTLDYYFCGRAGSEYKWGHRFGGGWWELTPGEMPNVRLVLSYLGEIEECVLAELQSLRDSDLARPFELDGSAETYLGHYIYALRHTMHHHGELAALAVQRGLAGGSWA